MVQDQCPILISPLQVLQVIAPSFSNSVKHSVCRERKQQWEKQNVPSLLNPKAEHMRTWQSDLKSEILPPSTRMWYCKAEFHQHITDGNRTLRALYLPEWFMGSVTPADWTMETAGACSSTEQQSITTMWDSSRNPSRASSWWHLCRGRKRNKGKRRQREWAKNGKSTLDFSKLESQWSKTRLQTPKHVFGVLSDSGGPALKPQITMPHTAVLNALVLWDQQGYMHVWNHNNVTQSYIRPCTSLAHERTGEHTECRVHKHGKNAESKLNDAQRCTLPSAVTWSVQERALSYFDVQQQ